MAVLGRLGLVTLDDMHMLEAVDVMLVEQNKLLAVFR